MGAHCRRPRGQPIGQERQERNLRAKPCTTAVAPRFADITEEELVLAAALAMEAAARRPAPGSAAVAEQPLRRCSPRARQGTVPER